MWQPPQPSPRPDNEGDAAEPASAGDDDGDDITRLAPTESVDPTREWHPDEDGEQLDPTEVFGDADQTRLEAGVRPIEEGLANTERMADAEDLDATEQWQGTQDATVLNPATQGDQADATTLSDTVPATGGERRELSSGGLAAAVDGVVVLSNRYQFHLEQDRLGGGGMGTVYRALDLQYQREVGRDRYFAVKVLNEKFAAHEAAVKSLVYETDRTRSLNHDHIARVYTFDRDGETIYMVMELLEGEALEDFIDKPEFEGGMPREQAFEIIRDIGEALAYAHAAGVVHSDFKPGNVFVTNDGGAKVIDFGIARAAANPDDVRGPITVSETRGQTTYFDPSSLHALTPTYASLEMFTGELPDEADDVYALAVVSYQMLTGRHPYNRKSALDVYQILQAGPNSAEAKSIIPERPPGLTNRQWRALRHGMEIERSRRTPTARQFLDEMFGTRASSISWIVLGLSVVVALGTVGYTTFMQPDAAELAQLVNIEANRDDLAAESELATARTRAMDLLAQTEFDEFWRRSAWQDLGIWRRLAGVTLDLGAFENPEAAEDRRRQIFELTGYGTRAVPLPDGSVGVRAGPFVPARNAQLEALVAQLEAAGIGYQLSDDAALIERFEVRTVERYVAALDDILAVAEQAQQRDDHDQALSAYEAANALLNELSERYTVAPDVLGRLQRSITNGRARSTAALGAQDRLIADVTAAWNCERISLGRISQGFSLLPQIIVEARRQQLMDGLFECLVGKTTEDGYDDLRAAAMRGNEARFGRLPPPVVLVDTGPTTEELVAEVQNYLVSDVPAEQDMGIELLVQRLVGGDLQESDLGQMFEAVAAHLQARIDAGHVDEARDRLELLRSSVPTFPRSVQLNFPRPDPCAAPALVGASRPCRDALDVDARAPALVVVPGVDGGRPYAITRDELTVAVYGQYCEVTSRCRVEGDRGFPVTGISIAEIESYAKWLSEHSGYTYRLPTVAEWRNAADANGAPADGNRNCTGTILGISRGESLQSAQFGRPNPWGLRNHLGNARELAWDGDQLVALGGAHTDPLRRPQRNSVSTTQSKAAPALFVSL